MSDLEEPLQSLDLLLAGGDVLTLTPGRPLLMGILNVTPDSFFDGGRAFEPGAAVAHGLRMVSEGADLLDVGGESTRPGAVEVPPEEEMNRVVPVIEELSKRVDVPLSVDTRHAATARAALKAGAVIVNDISGLADPAMIEACLAHRAAVVIMHMRGTPADMQSRAVYEDVVREVVEELAERVRRAVEAGIPRRAILVDPGIGFAKTAEQSLTLIRELRAFRVLGGPILVGPSRKSFLDAVMEKTPAERLHLSLGAVMACAVNGAHVLRVHDVLPTRQALRAFSACRPAPPRAKE